MRRRLLDVRRVLALQLLLNVWVTLQQLLDMHGRLFALQLLLGVCIALQQLLDMHGWLCTVQHLRRATSDTDAVLRLFNLRIALPK
jgi:hypothetical protein